MATSQWWYMDRGGRPGPSCIGALYSLSGWGWARQGEGMLFQAQKTLIGGWVGGRVGGSTLEHFGPSRLCAATAPVDVWVLGSQATGSERR